MSNIYKYYENTKNAKPNKNIREFIIANGGKFYFSTKAVDFNIQDNQIKSVICQIPLLYDSFACSSDTVGKLNITLHS